MTSLPSRRSMILNDHDDVDYFCHARCIDLVYSTLPHLRICQDPLDPLKDAVARSSSTFIMDRLLVGGGGGGANTDWSPLQTNSHKTRQSPGEIGLLGSLPLPPIPEPSASSFSLTPPHSFRGLQSQSQSQSQDDGTYWNPSLRSSPANPMQSKILALSLSLMISGTSSALESSAMSAAMTMPHATEIASALTAQLPDSFQQFVQDVGAGGGRTIGLASAPSLRDHVIASPAPSLMQSAASASLSASLSMARAPSMSLAAGKWQLVAAGECPALPCPALPCPALPCPALALRHHS
jgi:hypothetical protein